MSAISEVDLRDWPEKAKQLGTVNDIQHGGTHYKTFTMQPWDVVLDWQLGYLDGTALKYISRWKEKNGIEDLQKAIHFLQKLIEVEVGKTRQLSGLGNGTKGDYRWVDAAVERRVPRESKPGEWVATKDGF